MAFEAIVRVTRNRFVVIPARTLPILQLANSISGEPDARLVRRPRPQQT